MSKEPEEIKSDQHLLGAMRHEVSELNPFSEKEKRNRILTWSTIESKSRGSDKQMVAPNNKLQLFSSESIKNAIHLCFVALYAIAKATVGSLARIRRILNN